jgi:predicted dehydrogenase
MKIGVIGCGNIFQHYLKNAPRFNNIEVVACASLHASSAEAKAAEFGLRAMSVDDLIRDPEIGLVLNLTVPSVHAEISLRALNAGKHVYSEKPLAIDLKDGEKILNLAREKGLRVGCAPDTILGDSHQLCRKILDSGSIGQVVSGSAFIMSRGPEAWHPNPFFFYEKGAGPLFDMGPYYLSALINFLGPVRSVSALTKTSFPERIAGCKEYFGKKIRVEVPTHYAGVLEFESGTLITCMMSWEVWQHGHAPIELYGSEGSLQMLSEAYLFGGPVKLFRRDGKEWEDQAAPERYPSGCRLVGVAEMVHAISKNQPHICSGELAYHVLEVMHAFEASSKSGQQILIRSRCERPGMLPDDLCAVETLKGVL